MRTRRVILFDDEQTVLDLLKLVFDLRGYEVLTFREPVICPLYIDSSACAKLNPCCDVLITDHRMPRMKGLDLLREQTRRGCKLDIRNKALISGYLSAAETEEVRTLGAAWFQKPFELDEISRWVDSCEARHDLSVRLLMHRKEVRRPCNHEVQYRVGAGPHLHRGTAINMSESGFCLKVPVPLLKDYGITLHAGLPVPADRALVRWSRQETDGTYLAGLQCY
ncbi:MAG: response regulator [Nitrospiraceae bacterium]|nr:response regulator [Nitrospiraceae bacterium]